MELHKSQGFLYFNFNCLVSETVEVEKEVIAFSKSVSR